MINQSDDHWMYFANNEGLLSYNGEQWNINKLPNGEPVRAVKFIDGLIYTGSYMDFGYWRYNSLGNLVYTSLVNKLSSSIREGEQIWHIEEFGDYIIFQSLSRLLSYHKTKKTISVTNFDSTISNLFKSGESVYFQVAEDGLYSIQSGGIKKEVGFDQIGINAIIEIFQWNNQSIAITRDNGLFTFNNGDWKSFTLQNYPINSSFFTAEFTEDEKLVLGSIGDGLFTLDISKQTIRQFVQPDIVNNTVLSLFEDEAGNIWCGLDNGISLIEKDSQLSIFSDITGILGTVYCSVKYQDQLYLGTNQGLYKRNRDSNSFSLIEGTSGQIWSLNVYQNKLFIGHDRGTFILNSNSIQQIFDGGGTWMVLPFKDGFIQGHYNGLSFFRIGDGFKRIIPLEGFDLSARNIIIGQNDELWVGHDHKGIFKLNIDIEEQKVKTLKNYEVEDQVSSGLYVFHFNDDIYYSTATTIQQYDRKNDSFSADNKLNRSFQDIKRSSGNSKLTSDDKWWAYTEDEIYYTSKDAFQEGINVKSVPISYEFRNISSGFENISRIDENRYLVGSNNGYTIFEIPFKTADLFDLEINGIQLANKDQSYKLLSKDLENPEFENQQNYLNFYFNVPVYKKFGKVKYSYRLKGFSEEWTTYRAESKASFENLPYGDYEFQVKARYDSQDTNTVVFSFSIAKPWFISKFAVFAYIVLLVLIIVITHHFYTRYYRRRHEKMIEIEQEKAELQQLEAQQEIMKLKNEQLETDVISKNRELAASTMNIIRKNEVLNKIKKELSEVSQLKDIASVLKTIDANIKEEDNWKFFKEAFDNADKDFLQMVKSKHPNLTSNDLKLCAYLRLNLSSKEIAPLLNISVRSVEIKRYRLRKKMELDHEQSLVNYILEF
ncbi:helix-turn-helix and ligand-binding sensor domain-containing protein [Zunongwangia endophytica]|uniref:Triple tyrosine motif-containing protein n=1 Tax=Zunongwangia endophytica TaxID=1808945 RepID=A0ABV8H7Q1_9FLAO|nr:triple tyrosine motif-containing protein [Zunongwangia endophytica]MDN3595270.1 triple tyrosine motif-containing protein [Zunongwangia endophytica]